MMKAKADLSANPYWSSATVAQALRTAPGRTDSADWNALESMVKRTQALYTVGTQGTNASGALLGAWPVGPLFSPGDDGSGVPGGDTDGTEGVGGARIALESARLGGYPYKHRIGNEPLNPPVNPYTGPVCKVKEFLLPKRWTRFPVEGGSASGSAGWRYCAEIEYVDEKPIYDCACCVYRHYWMSIVGSIALEDPAYQLDVSNAEGRQYGGGRDDDSKPGDPESEEKEVGKVKKNGCRLSFYDRPQSPVSTEFELTWDYIGVVYDRCRNWKIVASKRMILYSKGSVVQEGGRSVVRYKATKASKNVPHEPAGTAWSHQNAKEKGEDGQLKLPGVSVDGLPDNPKGYGTQKARDAVGLNADCPPD